MHLNYLNGEKDKNALWTALRGSTHQYSISFFSHTKHTKANKRSHKQLFIYRCLEFLCVLHANTLLILYMRYSQLATGICLPCNQCGLSTFKRRQLHVQEELIIECQLNNQIAINNLPYIVIHHLFLSSFLFQF